MKFSTKLVSLYSLLLLAGFSVITWYGHQSSTRILEAEIRARLEDHAYHDMQEIDRMLRERRLDMQGLAGAPFLTGNTATQRSISGRLKAFKASHPYYSSLALFDMNRRRIADASGGNPGERDGNAASWKDIAAGREFAMMLSGPTGSASAVLSFSHLVEDRQGEPSGVVVATMSVDNLHEIAMQNPSPGDDKQSKWELLDKDGRVLYSNVEEAILMKQSKDWASIEKLVFAGAKTGSSRHAYGGEEEITAFARQNANGDETNMGWLLIVCTPAREAFLPVAKQRKTFLLTLSAIGFTILTVTVAVSRRVTKPIIALSKAAREIGKGNLDVRVDDSSQDEIGLLAGAFNKMALALKESERKYRDLAELLPQVVYEVDETGRILFANRHGLKLFGYAPEDLERGLDVAQMFIPADRDGVRDAFQKALRGESADNAEYTALRKNGTTFPFLTFTVPAVRDNNIIGLRGIGIDITGRKDAEEKIRRAKEEWDRTFDAITAPIMILDAHHKIIKANQAMAGKLGVTPAEATGLTCYEAVHDKDEPPIFCPHSELLADGRTHSCEVHEERLGGHYVITVSPLFTAEGKLYGSVHYASDITERKRAEEKINMLNAELERKVEERTRQLIDAQDELVRKEKLATLGQLAGIVGHELRNPLGVMNNAVYFLQTVLTDASDISREYLGIIKSEIAAAERIVSGLLDAVRTKPPHPELVQAEELIRMSLDKCRVPEEVTVEVACATRRSVLIDPLQMTQVFINLISNAVEAMTRGGTLKIAAQEDPDAERVKFSFRDEGVGIAPENANRLFQPLFTTKARGIGLGLVVVRNLTEANGGTVSAESAPGKGTTFTVTVPVARQ